MTKCMIKIDILEIFISSIPLWNFIPGIYKGNIVLVNTLYTQLYTQLYEQ